MLTKFYAPILARQNANLPDIIARLEQIRSIHSVDQAAFLSLGRVVHDLRNELCLVSLCLELHALQEGQVDHTSCHIGA